MQDEINSRDLETAQALEADKFMKNQETYSGDDSEEIEDALEGEDVPIDEPIIEKDERTTINNEEPIETYE